MSYFARKTIETAAKAVVDYTRLSRDRQRASGRDKKDKRERTRARVCTRTCPGRSWPVFRTWSRPRKTESCTLPGISRARGPCSSAAGSATVMARTAVSAHRSDSSWRPSWSRCAERAGGKRTVATRSTADGSDGRPPTPGPRGSHSRVPCRIEKKIKNPRDDGRKTRARRRAADVKTNKGMDTNGVGRATGGDPSVFGRDVCFLFLFGFCRVFGARGGHCFVTGRTSVARTPCTVWCTLDGRWSAGTGGMIRDNETAGRATGRGNGGTLQCDQPRERSLSSTVRARSQNNTVESKVSHAACTRLFPFDTAVVEANIVVVVVVVMK